MWVKKDEVIVEMMHLKNIKICAISKNEKKVRYEVSNKCFLNH
jgi:hypothetical protein